MLEIVQPGLRFSRYEVGERLGKGSFGVVHVARDTELGREVAIKFLRPEFLMRGHIVQRFIQEARAAAMIGHPGIVTVFECGLVSGTGQRIDGTAYIVMERLQGESLGDRLTAKTAFTYAAIVAIGRQLATALQAAHTAGIIHRDLKPDNVFLVPDAAVIGGERAKILDFGIAKLDDPGPGGVDTHSKMILGTPRYMSPEQARSSTNIDARSDIYALGCMLYELISGRAPFEGDSGDIMFQHQTEPAPPPSSLIGNVPEALDSLIAHMLVKQSDKRPATMQAVDTALAGVKGGDDAPVARSKIKFVEQPVITAVVEPPRPKRISAAGELTTRRRTEDKPVVVEQVEVDMYADVTDPENPLLRRAKSEPAPTASQERTAPVAKQPPIIVEERVELDPLEAELRTDRDLRAVAQRTLATRRRREIPKAVLYAGAGSLFVIVVIVIARGLGGGPSSPSPDAAVEITPDARRSTFDPKEVNAWIESECKIARADKNWLALERCGRALSERDARAGRELVELAVREAMAELSLGQLREAATTGDLAQAITETTAIPEDSVYRSEAVDVLRRAVIDKGVTVLDAQAAAHDCERYERTLSEIQNRHGQSLRDEIASAAKPCRPRTAGTPTPVVVRDEDDPPDLDALPDAPTKPLDCSDPERIERLELAGDAAMGNGSFAIALASFEGVVKCKNVMQKAYLAACRARNFAKAKAYYDKLGRESLAQICMKEGFDPRR
jgi:serine/threonine protein kinase